MLSWWCAALAGLHFQSTSADQRPLIPTDNWSNNIDWSLLPVAPSDFTLRHIYHHGTHDYPTLHRYSDLAPEISNFNPLSPVRLTPMQIERLVDRSPSHVDSLLAHAQIHGEPGLLSPDSWSIATVPGPNTTDKSTVVAMAKMAYDAYVPEPFEHDWKDITSSNHTLYNHSHSFGWKSDGLRGHVFLDQTNTTMVISLKGTSTIFDGETTTDHDKLNDNLFASCCCGQGVHYRWMTACECMTSAYACNDTCVRSSLRGNDHYYQAGRELYGNITSRYPNITNVWLSGHSLGGVVASLLGLTYGIPVMTFEAFPDALAASRLGLPAPPGYHSGQSKRGSSHIYHYGHTADPIFMGTYGTVLSTCTLAGYAFESLCHTGSRCVYDTVGDLGWRSSISSHRIATVIPRCARGL